MIIALTGGIGSGKSTVAQIFRECKVEVVDADQLTRQLVAPGQPALEAIIEHFGKAILQVDGTLNRAKLRSRIFDSTNDRKWLENLLHPLVKGEIQRIAKRVKAGDYVIIEIPLLIEANFEEDFDRILVVDCHESQQIERVALRDAMPRTTIGNILKAQAERNVRLAAADDVIENDSTRDVLKTRVKTIHSYYSELAKQNA